MKFNCSFCIAYVDVDRRREHDCMAAPAPGSLAAFPPSMEVRSGGRATQGALLCCTPSALFNKTAQRLLLTLLFFCPFSVSATDAWSYHQEKDRLSNETYSFAQSPLPPRGLYDYLRLEIICKENTLQVAIDANSLIASQGRTFGFEYQIDNKPAVTLQMTTFKDSKRRGYTEEYAQRIVNDLLTGKSLFIRVNTMIRKVLSAKIPLEGAAKSVKQAASDCGLSLADNATAESAYSLAEFEQELSKLAPEQQRQVLSKIKTIIIETQKALLIEK